MAEPGDNPAHRRRRRRHCRLDDGRRAGALPRRQRAAHRPRRIRSDRHRRRRRRHHPADPRIQRACSASTRRSSFARPTPPTSSASTSSAGPTAATATSTSSARSAGRSTACPSTSCGCATAPTPPSVRSSDYSMSAVAAARHRFGHPSPDPADPLSQLAYAFHFDASAYGRFLRRYAEAHGAERIEGRIVGVEQDSESGFVTAVTLEDDRRVARRPVRRLLRLPQPAARADARSRVRGLVALAALRPRDRGAVGAHRAAAALHPHDRPPGRLAMAHPAPAPHRQRPRLLQRADEPTTTPSGSCSKRSMPPPIADAAPAALHRRPAKQGVGSECRRHRPVVRLPRAAGIDQHPPDAARHPEAAQPVPEPRHQPGRARRIQPPHGRQLRAGARLHHPPLHRQPPLRALLASSCARWRCRTRCGTRSSCSASTAASSATTRSCSTCRAGSR